MRRLLLVLSALTVGGCTPTVSRKDYDALAVQLKVKEQELDELKNGPARMLAQAQSAVRQEHYADARQLAHALLEKHPYSKEAAEAKEIEQTATAKVAAAEADAERQARAQKEGDERRQQRALRHVVRKDDDVEGGATYRHDGSPEFVNDRSEVFLRILKPKDQDPRLALVVTYVSDEWLFIHQYVFNADGETFTIEPGLSEVQTDNGRRSNGEIGIWEWYQLLVNAESYGKVRAMANAERVTLRCRGRQYKKDRMLSDGEKARMREVLAAFEALGGRPPAK